jgi:hypothetical protein
MERGTGLDQCFHERSTGAVLLLCDGDDVFEMRQLHNSEVIGDRCEPILPSQSFLIGASIKCDGVASI